MKKYFLHPSRENIDKTQLRILKYNLQHLNEPEKNQMQKLIPATDHNI